MLILKAKDFRQALPMQKAIETQVRAYVAVATRSADLPLRTAVQIPELEAVALFMPARVSDNLGAKIVSVYPRNKLKDLPSIHGLVVLLDSSTGRPLAVLDASYLTSLRTAAGTAVATDLLANPDAQIGAIIGSGALARTHILALCEIRLLSEIRIYSRTPDHVAALIAEIQPTVPTVALVAAPTPSAAINNADIVCCCTTSTAPVIDGNELKPGAHVNGVGSYTLQMQEVDLTTVRRAGRIFVDSRESVLAEAGDVVNPLQQGIITKDDLIEIGLVINGQHGGRSSADAITFFKSCGLAAQDVVAAAEAVRQAQILGLGTEVEL